MRLEADKGDDNIFTQADDLHKLEPITVTVSFHERSQNNNRTSTTVLRHGGCELKAKILQQPSMFSETVWKILVYFLLSWSKLTQHSKLRVSIKRLALVH